MRTGDILRVDLVQGRCDALVSAEEIAARQSDVPGAVPESQTPWQKIYFNYVGLVSDAAVLGSSKGIRAVASRLPRHNH